MFKIIILASIVMCSLPSYAALIGHWEFNDTTESVGNFEDLELYNNATIQNGALYVEASNNDWARSLIKSTSSVGTIKDKTMVVQVTLGDYSAITGGGNGSFDINSAGSAFTLDRSTIDTFDAVVYGEGVADKWINGSNNHTRSKTADGQFIILYDESDATRFVTKEIAISFESVIVGGDEKFNITTFVDGVLQGDFLTGAISTYDTTNAEILFGVRHTLNGLTGPQGSLDAQILDAKLYNTALTTQQEYDEAAAAVGVNAPATLGVFAVALFTLLRVRRNK